MNYIYTVVVSKFRITRPSNALKAALPMQQQQQQPHENVKLLSLACFGWDTGIQVYHGRYVLLTDGLNVCL